MQKALTHNYAVKFVKKRKIKYKLLRWELVINVRATKR